MVAREESARSRWVTIAWAACALALTPCASSALAQTGSQRFQDARAAYTRGAYDEVVDLLEPMVGGPELVPSNDIINDGILVQESRKYLAAVYVLTGREDDAERQFEALLRSLGDEVERYDLDDATFPAAVHEVFDRIRGQLVAEVRERDRERRQTAAERERLRRAAVLSLYELAREDEVEVESHLVLALMPFGAGQFQNGDEGLGWLFFTSEAALSLTAAGLLVAHQAVEDTLLPLEPSSDEFRGFSEIRNQLQIANLAFGISAVIVMVVGIAEALTGYQPRRTIRREREVDPEILDRLELVGAPGGAGLRVRF